MNPGGKVPACPICGSDCALYDTIDFGRTCSKVLIDRGNLEQKTVQYVICGNCGFCFAPEFSGWSQSDFAERIYNDQYVLADPDYVEVRPRRNAEDLIAAFGPWYQSINHLDYGGGAGILAKKLREHGWKSSSYDPFVDVKVRPTDLPAFDLITVYEVFEHVPDIRALMTDLKKLLAARGVLLFSTLLSDGKVQPGRRLDWWYAAPRNGHISLYSRSSLGFLARDFGFNFGSFSAGLHVFFEEVPRWAEHLLTSKYLTVHTQ